MTIPSAIPRVACSTMPNVCSTASSKNNGCQLAVSSVCFPQIPTVRKQFISIPMTRARKRIGFHTIDNRSPNSEQPNFALADFVAPADTGIQDYIGAFAVTAGIGIDEHVARFEASHDEYNTILLKALADRLAEAFAERLHERVRKEFWGYAVDEAYDNDALIKEVYGGIARRPAILPAGSPRKKACSRCSMRPTLPGSN